MNMFNNKQSKAFAREIVKHRLEKNLDGDGISATSKQYVHIVATNTRQLTLDVVRQTLLLCHFPNFDDTKGVCRTHVTILAPQTDEQGLKELEQRLSTPEHFGNLLAHCVHSIHTEGDEDVSQHKVTKSFIDIEIEIVGLMDKNADRFMTNFTCDANAIVTVFANSGDVSQQTERSLTEHCHQFFLLPERIEENPPLIPKDAMPQAKLANMIYYASTYNAEIYLKDITNAAAYTPAMKTFLLHTPEWKVEKEWNALGDDALKLSNLYCVDAFEYRLRSIGCELLTPKRELQKAVNANILDLSRAEHARWNVEKLILGFRPLTDEERYEDEMTFGKAQETLRRKLKKEHHVHIDLCSYNTLRRIDPGAVKYDVFLMLSMPEIINRHETGTVLRLFAYIKRLCGF